MTKTKYIMSGGLAFAEEKDMDKLRRYSLKGWHVRDFKFIGYVLEKGERSDYVYSIDYRGLEENEKEEYFDFFSSSGWSHVASEADIHLFRAKPGTKPIYTDRETTVEKYDHVSHSLTKLAIPLMLITVFAWIAATMSSSKLQLVFLIVAILLTMLAVPLGWTTITSHKNKWKIEGRTGLVNLVKVLFVFLLIVIIGLLIYIIGMGGSIRILISALIGGIALPTAVWVIMSIMQKARK